MSSPFSDIDEVFAEHGYGNQWSEVVDQTARYLVVRTQSDLERLIEYRIRNPERIREAVRRASRKFRLKKRVERCVAFAEENTCIHCGGQLNPAFLAMFYRRLPNKAVCSIECYDETTSF